MCLAIGLILNPLKSTLAMKTFIFLSDFLSYQTTENTFGILLSCLTTLCSVQAIRCLQESGFNVHLSHLLIQSLLSIENHINYVKIMGLYTQCTCYSMSDTWHAFFLLSSCFIVDEKHVEKVFKMAVRPKHYIISLGVS